MPFIFHSKKQSIFQRKPSRQGQIERPLLGAQAFKKQESPVEDAFTLCKEHPFRKWNRPREIYINTAIYYENGLSEEPKKKEKPLHRHSQKIKKNQKIEKTQNNKSNSIDENKQDLKFFPKVDSEVPRIHRQNSNGSESEVQKQRGFRYVRQQSNPNGERLKYEINQTPGPGSYNFPSEKNSKAQFHYSNQAYVRSLPQPQRNSLQTLLLSIQNKFPQREAKKLMLDCNYKNQNSPSFKSSILRKDNSLKKNGALLSMLFSKKNSQNKENQSQTTCDSRMAATATTIFDDGYEKNEQTSPNPFSYNPNMDFIQPNNDKKSKPFLSGSPKNLSYLQSSMVPGPGTYGDGQAQKGDVFNQNQNKKPNKFELYQESPENVCAFSTAVPRQLHFDTQKLCQQEFYYSPKNNMSEIAEMKVLQGNRSNKCQFGSSLERFPKDQIREDDPYKYCFSKIKLAKNSANCPSLTFKGKRELFSLVDNTVSPNMYNCEVNTIYKSTEKELFKKLLQEKYQDEVILLKEKKKNMESVLIEQNRKNVDIKTAKIEYENLNPDKYREFLWKAKTIEKENISFGYNQDSIINRSIEPRKQLDGYYDTEPSWQKKSFNRQYGYEVAEY